MGSCGEMSPPINWRVVLFTNLLPEVFYSRADAMLREAGHSVVGVVTTAGPKRRRSDSHVDVVAAADPEVDVIVSNHPAYWAAMLAPLRADLIFCCGFPWRIPPDVLALPRLGAINAHPSLLPKGRGPGAIAWALRNGDAELGGTVHWLSSDFDTGNILAQGTVPLVDEDDFETATEKLDAMLVNLIRDALPQVASSDPGEMQDEAQATYAPMFEDSWRSIDWTATARHIHFQVRSWTGERDYPRGALGVVEGENLQIIRTRLLPNEADETHNSPGNVLSRRKDRLVIQCGDGPLEIVTWNQV